MTVTVYDPTGSVTLIHSAPPTGATGATGSPPPPVQKGNFDSLTTTIAVGWATRNVSIFVDGVNVATVTPSLPRPDVVAVYPSFPPNTGWSVALTLAPGTHSVDAKFPDGSSLSSSPQSIVVPSGPPVYAAPVFSFPASLPLSVGIATPLSPYVSSALPLVFTPLDTTLISMNATGVVTAKMVGTATLSVEVDDGH